MPWQKRISLLLSRETRCWFAGTITLRWRAAPHYGSISFPERQYKIEAVALSRRANAKPYTSILRQCDSRFVITFDNLAEVLDEINTLIEVMAALQEAARGILYNNWNKQFSD